MAKWEYKVIAFKTKIEVSRRDRNKNPVIQNVQDELNELGEQSWELIGVQNIRLETGMLYTVAYLKREKTSS